MLVENKINEFLDDLASNSPAPGGGAVSALLGGLSAALCSMMASLTVGKKGCEDAWQGSEKVIENMKVKISKFNELMDKDATSFDGVISALKLPKETEEEKMVRKNAIQAGYKLAIAVPIEICDLLVSLIGDIEYIIDNGNKNVVTDALAAIMCLKTGVFVALLNVKINMKSVKDESYVNDLKEKIVYFEKLVTETEAKLLTKTGF